jgi:hypothetical protein
MGAKVWTYLLHKLLKARGLVLLGYFAATEEERQVLVWTGGGGCGRGCCSKLEDGDGVGDVVDCCVVCVSEGRVLRRDDELDRLPHRLWRRHGESRRPLPRQQTFRLPLTYGATFTFLCGQFTKYLGKYRNLLKYSCAYINM